MNRDYIDLDVSRQNRKYIIYNMVALILSFFNAYLLIGWMLFASIYNIIKRNIEGALMMLLLIQFRSLLTSSIAVPMGSAMIIKWICVFGLTIFILLSTGSIIESLEGALLVFGVYLMVAACINSSFPTTAIFKVISYILPFLAIIRGIKRSDTISWIRISNWLFGVMLFGSILLISSPIGYLVNGTGFQGFTSHPNMYGILMVLFVSGVVFEQRKRFSLNVVLIVLFAYFLIILSNSRTSLASLTVIIVVYIFTLKINLSRKILLISSILIVSIIFISIFSDSIYSFLMDFLYKGNSSNILFSRENQIQRNMSRFMSHPILGTGFNVPYSEGVRSWDFSFDSEVENGNLIMALLADTGMIGTFLFAILFTKIVKRGEGIVLFLAPILVSMGEMVFFSTNSLGILLYFYYGIYLKSREENKFESSICK